MSSLIEPTATTSKLRYTIPADLRAGLDYDRYHHHRIGFWLPRDRKVIVAWQKQLMNRIRQSPATQWDPTIVNLANVVKGDPVLLSLSQNMLDEVPQVDPYHSDPTGNKELHTFAGVLDAFNTLLSQGPQWSDVANKVGLIGCPFNAILDWPMATAAGYMFFLFPKVNQALQEMLAKWEQYLRQPESIEVLLPPFGWLGDKGGLISVLKMARENGIGPTSDENFPQIFKCPNPNDPNTYGFENWDAFFTREFMDDRRPVANPEDDSVIVHPCESAPLQFPVSHVQLTDNFMGKNQLYSLLDMMDQHELAPRFVGGTVYQAFLSCLSYHRWHSPVSGKIIAKKNVPGTYYAQNLYQTFFGHWPEGTTPDPAGPTWSQPFIASVAARALIFIQADNPAIGLVCLIPIGMSDTSSAEITVGVGDRVKKGEQLGMFHFGGSTYCLLFGPGVNINWIGIPPQGDPLYPKAFDSPNEMPNFRLNSLLATVTTTSA